MKRIFYWDKLHDVSYEKNLLLGQIARIEKALQISACTFEKYKNDIIPGHPYWDKLHDISQ